VNQNVATGHGELEREKNKRRKTREEKCRSKRR
jgi:hypothetical protein